jgi:thiol-disulfide isomerase/thioredoxin
MTSNSRRSKRAAARAADRSSGRSRWLWPLVGGGVLIVAAIVAIALSSGQDTGGSSARPSGSPASSVAAGAGPVVTGAALPVFAAPDGDPAIGQAIPTVKGASFSGAPVAIEADGRPKVLLFLAHWCSHCQAEVPVVQAWIDGGGAPTDVDLISVVTAIDPTLPNYPPDAWLTGAGWTVPVIVDPAGTVADAYGLSAFPFWVFVDGDGQVVGRRAGEMSVADLEAVVASLAP